MTAIEWLIEELANNGIDHIYLVSDITDKAKEMEKQQIIDAYDNGAWMQSVKERLDYDHEDYKFNNSDEYYNTI